MAPQNALPYAAADTSTVYQSAAYECSRAVNFCAVAAAVGRLMAGVDLAHRPAAQAGYASDLTSVVAGDA